jgi:hypothetical protein
MTQADADHVYQAGWSERVLHDAILVCCRFNCVNLFAIAHSLDTTAENPEDQPRNMG